MAVTIASSGTGGTHTYRTPAAAVTTNGTIVIAYDARRHTAADLPNLIDIVTRRSTDNGQTFTPETIAVRHAEGDTPTTAYGVGDPSLTNDTTTGKLWLHYLAAPPGRSIHNSTTATHIDDRTTVHTLARYSTDHGATWSAPLDLTPSVKAGGLIGGIFATAGHGTQLANGTLTQPYAYYRGAAALSAANAYSTDHGTTWHLGPEIGAGLEEHRLAQLANGTLLDSARSATQPYRALTRAATITAPWATPEHATALPDPRCNGDLLRVDLDPTSPRAGWLLHSNPDSQTTRLNGAIRLSTDNGHTWPHAWNAQPGPFGYSVLIQLADGSFGLVYEHRMPASLVFQRFDLTVFTPQ